MDAPVRLEGWDAGAVTITGVGRPSTKSQAPPSSGKYGFNLYFLMGLFKLAAMSQIWDLYLLLSLVASICLNLYVGSQTGKVTGQFYSIIVNKSWDLFPTVLWKSALIVIFSALLESWIKFILDVIGYRWRRNLVRNLHERYFSDSMFYQVLHLDGTIDNPYVSYPSFTKTKQPTSNHPIIPLYPFSQFDSHILTKYHVFILFFCFSSDQRITQDLDLLTRSLGSILRAVFEGPLQIGYYGYLSIATITWYSPLLIVGYWIVAYVVNMLLMSPSVRYVFRQEQLEGHFRFGHVRVRTHSESIALNTAGRREHDIANVTFSSLMRNRWHLISWETAVTTATNVFAYFASVINYTIIALPVWKGWKLPDSPGGAAAYVSNASFRLMMFINGFTQFNNISRELSDFIGYSNRVAQMFEVIDKLQNSEVSRHLNDSSRSDPYFAMNNMRPSPSYDATEQNTSPSSPHTPSPAHLPQSHLSINREASPIQDRSQMPESQESKPEIIFQKVSIYTPIGQPLLKNLSLSIAPGQNLLVTGPNGSGKSSLIRCLSGLWRTFDGTISRPSSVLFLPQKPYLPYGNLQDQVMYPLTSAASLLGLPADQRQSSTQQIETEQMLSILRDVELQYLVNRPEVADSLSIATRETLRNIIEDQDGDSLNVETTGLLAAVSRTHDTSSDASTLLNEIEGSNLNWTEVLSPGEQQRLGLARVLYHKPCFAVLDESTSSVDEALEEKFYNLCRHHRITVITIGHKSSLKRFHQLHLHVDRRGYCNISEII